MKSHFSISCTGFHYVALEEAGGCGSCGDRIIKPSVTLHGPTSLLELMEQKADVLRYAPAT